MPTLLKFSVLVLESFHHLLVPAIALDLPCQSSHFLLDLFGLLVTICFRQLVDLTLHFLHLLPGPVPLESVDPPLDVADLRLRLTERLLQFAASCRIAVAKLLQFMPDALGTVDQLLVFAAERLLEDCPP